MQRFFKRTTPLHWTLSSKKRSYFIHFRYRILANTKYQLASKNWNISFASFDTIILSGSFHKIIFSSQCSFIHSKFLTLVLLLYLKYGDDYLILIYWGYYAQLFLRMVLPLPVRYANPCYHSIGSQNKGRRPLRHPTNHGCGSFSRSVPLTGLSEG